jgi:hypothetical protein
MKYGAPCVNKILRANPAHPKGKKEMSIHSRAMRAFDNKKRPDYEALAVLPDRSQLAADVLSRTAEYVLVCADTLRLIYPHLSESTSTQIARRADLTLWLAPNVIEDCQALSETFEAA